MKDPKGLLKPLLAALAVASLLGLLIWSSQPNHQHSDATKPQQAEAPPPTPADATPSPKPDPEPAPAPSLKTLQVVATDTLGRPLPRVELRANPGEPPRGMTDGAGAVELPWNGPRILAQRPGYTAREFTNPDQGPLQITLAPSTLSLEVQLSPLSPPPSGQCQIACAGHFPATTTAIEEDGVCRFTELPQDTLCELWAFGDVAGSPIAHIALPHQGRAQLEMSPNPPITFEVRGRDDNGQLVPIAAASLSIAEARMHLLARNSITDQAGQSTFSAWASPTLFLSIHAAGYLPHHSRVELLEPALEPALLNPPRKETVIIELDRGVQLRGRVVDLAGAGLPDARLIAKVTTDEGATWRIHRDEMGYLHRLARPTGGGAALGWTSFSTWEDGSFELAGIPPGRIQLGASATGWVLSKPAQIDARDISDFGDLRVVMAPGCSLFGRVTASDGSPLPQAELRWRPQSADAWGWRDWQGVDERGFFRLEGVAPELELEARAPQSLNLRQMARCGEDSAVVLETTLTQLELTVMSEAGVVSKAEVFRVDKPSTSKESCRGRSDYQGHVVLRDCTTPLVLQAQAEGFAPTRVCVTEEARPSAIQLEGGAQLHGTLVGLQASDELHVELEASLESGCEVMSPLWTRGAILKADEAIDWQELPALEGTLTLSAPGYAELSLPIALGPGEIRDLGALSLSPQALTRGVVLDPYGSPLAGVRVFAQGDPELATFSEASGAFELPIEAPEQIEGVDARYGFGAGQVQADGSYEIRLNQRVGDDWEPELRAQGLQLAREEQGWILLDLDSDSPWLESGLQPGDQLELYRPPHLYIQRGEQRLRVDCPDLF